jgi:hypothetical protein
MSLDLAPIRAAIATRADFLAAHDAKEVFLYGAPREIVTAYYTLAESAAALVAEIEALRGEM